MTGDPSIGLGELLRHLTDLLDSDAERANARMGVGPYFRARYTPIVRAFRGEPLSISELQEKVRITQGAISQTVKLMEAEGLLRRVGSPDRRERKVALTRKGQRLKERLSREWEIRLAAIADLETALGVPLRRHLAQAITSLERESYDHRIERIRKQLIMESAASSPSGPKRISAKR